MNALGFATELTWSGLLLTLMNTPANTGLVPDVLVVDDEPQIREIVTQYLEKEGYSVRAAADGDQALAMLATKPEFPLNLPGGRHRRASHFVNPSAARPSVTSEKKGSGRTTACSPVIHSDVEYLL